MISSRSCCLVTHSSNAAAIWDADAKTLLQPMLKNTMCQQACDAMYLDDGEAYILLKNQVTDPDVYSSWVVVSDTFCDLSCVLNEVKHGKTKSKQSLIGVADWVGILFGSLWEDAT